MFGVRTLKVTSLPRQPPASASLGWCLACWAGLLGVLTWRWPGHLGAHSLGWSLLPGLGSDDSKAVGVRRR